MAEKDSSSGAAVELTIDKSSLERIIREEIRIELIKNGKIEGVSHKIGEARAHFQIYKSHLDEYLRRMKMRGREGDFAVQQFEKNAVREFNYAVARINEVLQIIEDDGVVRVNDTIKITIFDLCKEIIDYYKSNYKEVPKDDLLGINRRNAFIKFVEKYKIRATLDGIIQKLKGEASVYNSKKDIPIPISDEMKDYSVGFMVFTLYPNKENQDMPRIEPREIYGEFTGKCGVVGINDVRIALHYLSEMIKEFGRQMVEGEYKYMVLEARRVVGGFKLKVIDDKKL